MKSRKQLGKNLAFYLGSAWVIMEAGNFFIDRYNLEPLLLDIMIIFLVFGIFSTVVFSLFDGRWNKKAMGIQVILVVFAFVSVGYFVTNPLDMNPRSIRISPFKGHRSPLRNLSSVAVLPIQNNLPNNENDYLLAGLHDGIITELGKLGTLKTISRTSMLQYAETPKSIKNIGKELDVKTILESSLTPTRDDYVLRVRLLETKSEELIWSDEFKTSIGQMPLLFDRISQIIATQLNPNAIENVRVHEEVNPEAYAEIIQGNLKLQKFTSDGIWEAHTHFKRAIELDSTNLEGYLGMAKTWIYLQQLSVVDPKEARPNIYRFFQLAEDIESDHWQIHYLDGAIKFFVEFDFEAGIQSILKSVEANPNNSDVRSALAHCYMIIGDWDTAWEQMRYAKEIDPLNPQVIGFEFLMFGQQGKFLSAMKSMELLAAIDQENLFFAMFSTVKNRDMGNDEEAIKWMKLLYSDLNDASQLNQYIDRVYKETNSVNETWFKLVTEYCKGQDYEGYYPSMAARTLYSFFPGYNDDLFFENMAIMVKDRHPDLPYFRIKDGSSLQDDPRYIKHMKDLGFW